MLCSTGVLSQCAREIAIFDQHRFINLLPYEVTIAHPIRRCHDSSSFMDTKIQASRRASYACIFVGKSVDQAVPSRRVLGTYPKYDRPPGLASRGHFFAPRGREAFSDDRFSHPPTVLSFVTRHKLCLYYLSNPLLFRFQPVTFLC